MFLHRFTVEIVNRKKKCLWRSSSMNHTITTNEKKNLRVNIAFFLSVVPGHQT